MAWPRPTIGRAMMLRARDRPGGAGEAKDGR
jgi:hypothetical protein